ncbi:Leucine-rich repeat-containing protein 4 [Sarcoptes scabiei]|uniref:Leucine-rich repeat-containing protein 4 n=1 Tax=Sarcoptes scabiei TaxID=52283 RepID=A0A834QZZ5_SARSC|nr:Leucine-rich repeat-containing protein 4 [Sarcoptes scabiei]
MLMKTKFLYTLIAFYWADLSQLIVLNLIQQICLLRMRLFQSLQSSLVATISSCSTPSSPPRRSSSSVARISLNLTQSLSLSSQENCDESYDVFRYHQQSNDCFMRSSLSSRRIFLFALAEYDFDIECPPERIIYPCRCHHNDHLVCTETMSYSLVHVFRAINKNFLSSIHYHLSSSSSSLSLNEQTNPSIVRPLFKEIIISHNNLEELDDNLFDSIRFKRIVLFEMRSLSRIKSNAFNGTSKDVHHFEIKGENKLGIKFMNQLFDALSCLTNVRQMHLELDHLESIPSYAFRNVPPQSLSSQSRPMDSSQSTSLINENRSKRFRLERLTIISKSLSQISSYAFYELNSLRYIRIHSNSLTRISAHAFDFAQPFSHSLVIDLHRNQLKLSSFEIDAFQQVNRPVHLNLAHNNLSSIPQFIFERFLNTDGKNLIKLAENPLECDCSIRWLLKDRSTYFDQISDAYCTNSEDRFLNIWSLNEREFFRCDLDPHYLPKLMYRNDSFDRIDLNHLKFLLSILLSIIVYVPY